MEEKIERKHENAPGGKKKYVKPGIVSENIFETKSMACGKCDAVGPSAYCFAGIETS